MAYRDYKPDDFVFDANTWLFVLIDFGLAQPLKPASLQEFPFAYSCGE